MFIRQYIELRESILTNYWLRSVGDLDWGAFREMKDVKVTISLFSACQLCSRGRNNKRYSSLLRKSAVGQNLKRFPIEKCWILAGSELYEVFFDSA